MAMIAVGAVGCARPEAGLPPPLAPSLHPSVLPAGQSIVATEPGEAAEAQDRALRALRRARDARSVETASAPFLQGSPLGRRFLALEGRRALARGAPPERCPGAGLASGPDAPEEALRLCLAAQVGAEDCGCALLAVDDALLGEQAAFAYAPGVSGRLIGLDPPVAGPLVVEERPSDEGTRVAFFGPGGPVAAAELDADGSARLALLDRGEVYEGVREPIGWRRGRLSERLLLTGPQGERLIALIGVEPGEFAAEGPALTDWPRG